MYFARAGDDVWWGEMDEEALRGVSSDVFNMDVDLAKGLAERRKLLRNWISSTIPSMPPSSSRILLLPVPEE